MNSREERNARKNDVSSVIRFATEVFWIIYTLCREWCWSQEPRGLCHVAPLVFFLSCTGICAFLSHSGLRTCLRVSRVDGAFPLKESYRMSINKNPIFGETGPLSAFSCHTRRGRKQISKRLAWNNVRELNICFKNLLLRYIYLMTEKLRFCQRLPWNPCVLIVTSFQDRFCVRWNKWQCVAAP
jgi:hypothetical protein